MTDGDSDRDDEQQAEATINAAESRQDSYYDCGLQISAKLLCLVPRMTYTRYKLGVRDSWSDAGHSGSGDMEDGVTLDVPSISSLVFTSLLHYFFGSRPSTNGIGTCFYHLQRQVKWRWSFPVRRMRRTATIRY